MPRKLLPLAFVLALVAAACAEPPEPDIEFGSGVRFVPMVADSLNNSGVEPSVAVTAEGLPIVAYFAFEEEPEDEDELPQTRPVGAPSIPGVLMATANREGVWTRGAIALESAIPNVFIPFNPAFDEAVADLTVENVTGLDLVVDEDAFHAVWGSAGGLYYATGSADPAATDQVQISKVTDTPPVGPSIAVVGGSPRIAYYTSTSSSALVQLARPSGNAWLIETVAEAGGCDTCATAAVAASGGLAIAYSDAATGVSVATNDGESGWQSVDVGGGSGGQGLAGTATEDGLALSYYENTQLTVATGTPGSFQTRAVSEVASDSDSSEGAGTSVAVDDAGTLWVAWFDADEGVVFASSGDDGFAPVETGPDTETGAMPSVDVTPDGTTSFLAWYDTEHEDALLGEYGEIEGLAIAAPSPEPVGPPVVQPGGECTQSVDGVVQITALGIAFDASCVEVTAGEPFTVAFDNEDDGVPHNVQIYPSSDEVSPDAALTQNEIIAGVASTEYQVDPLDAGEYYFQCDVHPDMNGTWNAVEGGGGGATGATGPTGGGDDGGDGGGGGGAVTVTAQNIEFDTATIELPADTEGTITFDNRDAGVPHNIAIFTDDSLSEVLFRGDVITGPDTIDYPIPSLEAGEYYFHCDIHPDMNGTVLVA